MEYFAQLMSSYIDDESTLRLLFSLIVGLAVFVALASVSVLVKAVSRPMRRRLAGIHSIDADHAARELAHTHRAKSASSFSKSFDHVAKYVAPTNETEVDATRATLIQAGFREEGAFKVFYALKTVSCLVFGALALIVIQYFPEYSANESIMRIGLAAGAGLMLPNFVLSKLAARRSNRVRKGFPDALDLFVVCVESGLGLAATIQRVGNEMEVSHPELAEELSLVTAEMRLGVDRIVALRGLAERTQLDEIKGLVALLDQSARFGTGIAQTLRVYADEFRDKRMQAAEEIAAKIGTKMIFPLTFFIWPSFFVVMVGPAVLGALTAFR